MSVSSASFWHKFFVTAGIPSQSASAYAVSFSENRITGDMLPDLSKDYLKDLGVKPLGDVIAILKHAQKINNEKAQKKAFEKPKAETKKPATSKQSTSGNVDQQSHTIQTTSMEPLNVDVDNDAYLDMEKNKRVSHFLQSFNEPSLPREEDEFQLSCNFASNQHFEVPERSDKMSDEKPVSKAGKKLEAKMYYSTSNPGSIFRRLGRKTENISHSASHDAKKSIFSRIGERGVGGESKRLSDVIIQSSKPVLQVRPKMTTISAGVLSPNSVQPPSGNTPSSGILSPYRVSSKSLLERLGKKIEDKTADQRLPINANAIAKFLK